MPEKVIKYQIFVASPSDVIEEREHMDEVIEELNHTFGLPNGITIELIKWETHSAPAIGSGNVQGIINKDIGEYDLFIGILWKKFGTPTDNANSGTEEEFLNAYKRYLKAPDLFQILFYFKTSAPLSLNDINPEEYSKVLEFKSKLGKKGVFYWDFNTKNNLAKFLRIHIPKRLRDLEISSKKKEDEITYDRVTNLKENPIEDELGLLDYLELMEDYFAYSNNAISRITESTLKIGTEINKKTIEINSLTAGKKIVGKKVLRDFFRKTATIMTDFASRIDPDIPIFISNFEKGADAFSNIINIYRSDFDSSNEQGIKEALDKLNSLSTGIEGAIKGMRSFLNSIITLPRISKELNNARVNVELKLKELINKLEVSYDITNELKKNLI